MNRRKSPRLRHPKVRRDKRFDKPAAAETSGPLIQVGKITPMRDFWGNAFRRPVPPEKIRGAIIAHLIDPDNLLVKSLDLLPESAAGGAQVREVKTVHFQEGDFQYIFRVSVRQRESGRLHLALVAAKEGGRTSTTARRELENLTWLYRRDNRYVVRPLAGGMVEIPFARELGPVFIYFTEWLEHLHELGVDKGLNFYINAVPFHTFRRNVNDILRGQILKILFSLYDPEAKIAMEPPQVASGDFVISRPRPEAPYELRLIACRRLLKGISLGKVLRLYLGYSGQWADKVFHFLPRDPAILFDALNQGLIAKNPGRITMDQVVAELKAWAAELEGESVSTQPWSPLPTLRKLIGSIHMMK